MNSNIGSLNSNGNSSMLGVGINSMNVGINNLSQMGLGHLNNGGVNMLSSAGGSSSNMMSSGSLNGVQNVSNLQNTNMSHMQNNVTSVNTNATLGMSNMNMNSSLVNMNNLSSGINNGMNANMMNGNMHLMGNMGGAMGINSSLNAMSGMSGLNALNSMAALRGDDGDDDGRDDGEVREQDRFLPVANIARIMKTVLPPNAKIAKDAKETIQECVSEFISFITSEASDKCLQEKRKTINGDDLLWAMSTLGFDRYIEPLKIYLNKYRDAVKGDKPEKKPTTGKKGELMSSSPSGMMGGMSHHSQSHQIIVNGIADDPILSAIASSASNINSSLSLPAISTIQSTYMNPDFDPRKRDISNTGSDWDSLTKKPKHS